MNQFHFPPEPLFTNARGLKSQLLVEARNMRERVKVGEEMVGCLRSGEAEGELISREGC